MGTPPGGTYHGTVRRCHLCHLDHCDAHDNGCDITRRPLVATLGRTVGPWKHSRNYYAACTDPHHPETYSAGIILAITATSVILSSQPPKGLCNLQSEIRHLRS